MARPPRKRARLDAVTSFIEHHFTCCICFETLDNPIRVCENEHYNCVTCIRKIITDAALVYSMVGNRPTVHWICPTVACPYCRAPVNLPDIFSFSNRLIYTLLPNGLIPSPCIYCGEVLHSLERAQHALCCEQQTIACKYCEKLCRLSQLDEHLVECAALTCPICQQPFSTHYQAQTADTQEEEEEEEDHLDESLENAPANHSSGGVINQVAEKQYRSVIAAVVTAAIFAVSTIKHARVMNLF